MAHPAIQTALSLIYPPRCLTCGGRVDSDFGLCGSCWRDTSFIAGDICDSCGVPLPGDTDDDVAKCDSCLTTARPWQSGRAAMLYKQTGRKLVLALKHGDRHDVARPAGKWLAQAARDLIGPTTLVAPVPLHWLRMAKRRYNQSALLAQALAHESGAAWCPDLLKRPKHTDTLDGKTRDARFEILRDAIVVHPKRRHRIVGRPVLLVDDVMTTGATLAAATQTCLDGGAAEVNVVVLARVAKDT